MKLFFVFQIFLLFSFPVRNFALGTDNLKLICESFAAGKIDAYKTLEALRLNAEDYSIGVNNTAKIVCF